MARRAWRFTLITATLVVATAVAVVFGTSEGSAGPPPRVSTPGTEIASSAISSEDQTALAELKANSAVRQLHVAGIAGFYRFTSAEHGTCYASGFGGSRDVMLGAIGCDQTFPSAERPILDQSVFGVGTDGAMVAAFLGFAADGVKEVGLVDAAGETTLARVVNNTYHLPRGRLPSGAVEKIVAYDATGSLVYELPLEFRQ